VRFGGVVLHPLLAGVLAACQADWREWAACGGKGGGKGRQALQVLDTIWLEDDKVGGAGWRRRRRRAA
jgi:hypothetical protein